MKQYQLFFQAEARKEMERSKMEDLIIIISRDSLLSILPPKTLPSAGKKNKERAYMLLEKHKQRYFVH